MTLQDYLRVLRRGWWIIAGSVTTGSVMVVAGLVCAPAAQAHAPATRRVPA